MHKTFAAWIYFFPALIFFFFLTNMLSQLTVFFISIVLRINLSSQKMLQLHVQFITLWDWFVKNVKHSEIQEQHTIPGSPICVQETSTGSTEEDSSLIDQLPNSRLFPDAGLKHELNYWLLLLLGFDLDSRTQERWILCLTPLLAIFCCSTPVFCITLTSSPSCEHSAILQAGHELFQFVLHFLHRG